MMKQFNSRQALSGSERFLRTRFVAFAGATIVAWIASAVGGFAPSAAYAHECHTAQLAHSYETACRTGVYCDGETGECSAGIDPAIGQSISVVVCHREPGCDGHQQTVDIPGCALDRHLEHGDTFGPCPDCSGGDRAVELDESSAIGDHDCDSSRECAYDADCASDEICSGAHLCLKASRSKDEDRDGDSDSDRGHGDADADSDSDDADSDDADSDDADHDSDDADSDGDDADSDSDDADSDDADSDSDDADSDSDDADSDDADSDSDSDSDSDDADSDSDSDSDGDADDDCKTDADCKMGQTCNPDTRTCEDTDTGCDTDADCPEGQGCNPTNGECQDPGAVCDDDTDCLPIETCDTSTGTCTQGDPRCGTDANCDDGDFCNGQEVCAASGECEAGVPPCDDSVACTIDACDETADVCEFIPADLQCDDGSMCNGFEFCDPQLDCIASGGAPVDCSDLDSVCGVGTCDDATGECVVDPANDGGACSDGDDLCTLDDACADGSCVGIPLCDSDCEACDAGVCLSLCGNPRDVTSAREVTIIDSLFILRASVQLEECGLCACDLDGSLGLSTNDALQSLRHVVGLSALMLCPDFAVAPASTTTMAVTETTTTTTTTMPLP